jgi:translocation and assembly module TamA
MAGLKSLALLILSLAFLAVPAVPAAAAEPVEVAVTGIEGDVLRNVREALALPPGLVREGVVDRLWLERFVRQAEGKVRTAMEPFGYYGPRVEVASETAADGTVRLRVTVAPGEPVRVSEVNLALHGPGRGEPTLRRRMADFPLAAGDRLHHQRYEEAKAALLAQALTLGYLDADFTVHEIRVAPAKKAARIRLEMETGGRYLFGEASIAGAPTYPDLFLRRYLAFKPGDFFSSERLGDTQLNYANSERFREINILADREAARDYRVPVRVQLTPAPRRSLRQGIGYGTDTGARVSARYRDLNMLEKGHEFYSNLYLSERIQGAATGYIVPDLDDIRGSTGLQFSLQREDLSAYDNRMIALELNKTRGFGPGESGSAYLRVQHEAYTIGAQESSSRVVLPGLRFSKDAFDSPIRPTRGFRYDLNLRGTHQLLGSDVELLQIISEGGWLLPLPWRLSLYSRFKAGITLLSDPLSDIPPSLRFFAGGDRSVRGYAYQSLGPLDASGRVEGGKHLLVGSAELERALGEAWGVSVFYDAGNAFNSFLDYRLLQGAGIGLHYYTRVGALNLSVARQIGVDDPGYHLHFTVGFAL